ncbi:MAG: prepilin-type N-terminal cleavage/methylation domain-containing protein [Lentisphaerae bacterium]|nr:prepilin-type N-terminal cleavage/methylation domain-containing protein [Lentisphaerota bacterium]
MNRGRQHGFTLLEVLVAVTILSIITGVTLMAFSVVSSAWRRGMVLSDNLHHGDFVMDQLVMAMRSAYFPEGAPNQETYGFSIEDNGDNPNGSDIISWVKLGSALVGRDSRDLENPEAPHRVEFFVAEDESGAPAAAVRAWSLLGQTEDFDADEVAPQFIARRIVGFNCRMQDPEADNEENEIEWIDEWENTNRLPYAVEMTLWMDPIEVDGDPIAIQRIVQIPLAPISWGRKAAAGSLPNGTAPARKSRAPGRAPAGQPPGRRERARSSVSQPGARATAAPGRRPPGMEGVGL